MHRNTTIRIRVPDSVRIKTHIKRLSNTGTGRYAANDVVKLALDALEEKINQTNYKSNDSGCT